MPSERTIAVERVQLSVADAMLTQPAVHPPWTTLGELRAFFRDDHVHMALLVDGGELLGTIERGDIAADLGDRAPALEVAELEQRVIAPDAALPEALSDMQRAARRRLAVTNGDSMLLGLLCLKESGRGFCSDADVRSRRAAS
jgi:predicted transcriptional regulator